MLDHLMTGQRKLNQRENLQVPQHNGGSSDRGSGNSTGDQSSTRISFTWMKFLNLCQKKSGLHISVHMLQLQLQKRLTGNPQQSPQV